MSGTRVRYTWKGTRIPKYTRQIRNIHEILVNPLSAELNPICHLLALLGAHHIFHVSGLRFKIQYKIHYLKKNSYSQSSGSNEGK